MPTRFLVRTCLATLLLAHPLAAPAAGVTDADAPDPIEGTVIAAGYLAHHPDLRHRVEGMRALEDGFPRQAIVEFRDAARYADKAAQAMLANMHWEGIGTPVDRALAYAWMDIAAERGYPRFIGWREHYWADLSEAERREAIAVGQPLMDEYGDAAAKPRLERELRRGAREQTGSRLGGSGMGVRIQLVGDTAGGFTSAYIMDSPTMSISGTEYYQSRYWKPDEYWAWQDRQWGKDRTGTVSVEPLERVDAAD